jgi:hypothetical protein
MLSTVARSPWTFTGQIDITGQIDNKYAQTSTPRVEIEPTTTVFERAKTVNAFDREAIVIGTLVLYEYNILY